MAYPSYDRDAPCEIAYRTPGEGWRRKSFENEAQALRFIERLDDDVEVRWLDR
jgi:hypothetical protein